MKKLSVIALALFGGVAFAQMPEGMPKREAGLWEMQTSMVEMGGIGMRLQTCVDDTVENLMPDEGNSDCDEPVYRKAGNRITFEATCRAEGSTARMVGTFTGDFTRSYQGEIRTTYTPPLQGMASSTVAMQARWVGPCRPDQKPGDVNMMGITGMENLNIEEMMKNMPR